MLDNTIEQKMEHAGEIFKKVSDKFNTKPEYTIWIDFKINSLHVNSTSQDANSNIIMSLNNEKNGSGYANSFTITIAHAPMAGAYDLQTHQIFNPNAIDEALLQMNVNGAPWSSRYCEIEYGYADETDFKSFRTVKYYGMVMEYTCEIQDSILIYVIKGFSGVTSLNESKDPLIITPNSDGFIKPTEAVAQIIERYLQAGRKHESGVYPISDYVSYHYIFDEGVRGSDQETIIPPPTDKNPSQAITDILNMAIPIEDAEKIENNTIISNSNKVYYGWYISDTVEASMKNTYWSGTIHIFKTDPKTLREKNDTDVNLVFNWMSPGPTGEFNHIVRSFMPKYDGKVLFALSIKKFNIDDEEGTKEQEIITQQRNGTYFINNSGQIERANVTSIAPATGGEVRQIISRVEQERSSWIHSMQYPYKADMITVGIPCEIPITGLIRIVPLIYGQKHHSAGIYMVLRTSDRLTTQGFETSWELIKVVKTEVEEDTTMNNNLVSGLNDEDKPRWTDLDNIVPSGSAHVSSDEDSSNLPPPIPGKQIWRGVNRLPTLEELNKNPHLVGNPLSWYYIRNGIIYDYDGDRPVGYLYVPDYKVTQ